MVRTGIAQWLRGRRPSIAGRALFTFALVLGVIVPSVAAAQDSGATEPSLLGNFTVVISIPDVQRDIANGPALYGRWQITFRADGSYGADRADLVGELISGTFVVDGDQVTVTDDSGLLSCSNGSIIGNLPDAATGVYRWNRTDDRLSMVPVADDCAGRRILFSTRQLTGYAPCATQPLALNVAASPEAQASPVAGTPDTMTPEAGSSPVANSSAEAAIDELLSQMTSCWATGQPEYFLPLMTARFRAEFLQSSSGTTDPIAELATLMASTPFVWQRTGDVELTDETNAVALVRQAVNNQEDFVRYAFALEDGEWRWNGAG